MRRFFGKKSFCLYILLLGYMTLVCWMISNIHNTYQTSEPIIHVADSRRTVPSPQIDESCLAWCRRGAQTKPPYFLTAVLLVRIYAADLAKLSTREMRQWLYYLRYAGVEHIYVYDAYHYKNESQQKALEPWITERYVTYVDWSHRAKPYSIDGTQHSAYQDCIDRWGNQTTWQSSIDIDEYPFSTTDTQPGFMARFIANFSTQHADLSQMTMQNFLFLGQPLDDTEHPFLIARLRRRTKEPANNLVKPIYQPKYVARVGVHHHGLRHGKSSDIPAEKLRLNHYWGARLQNWGEDTPDILSKTEPDNSMEHIVASLRKCDVCLPDKHFIYRAQWSK